MVIDKNNYNKFLSDDDKTLDCTDGGITEIKYLPEGLKELYCHYNNLTYLPDLPESLIRLVCEYNELTTLPELPKSLEELDCRANPNLPYAGYYEGKEQIKQLRKRINMDLYLLGKI